jgi:transglutaminase-like putative cysteine protease
MKYKGDLSMYLGHTYFIDSDSPAIIEYASTICYGKNTDKQKAIALYYRVRDDIRYDPYSVEDNREALRASSILKREACFCVAKANLQSFAMPEF